MFDLNGDTENKIERLNFDSIFAKGHSKFDYLLIASAFTDIKFIDKIITVLKKKKYSKGSSHLAIYLDENASRYFSNENIKKSLDKSAKRIRDKRNHFDESSGIYLVKCGTLFHSKFYISESRTISKIVLGSANFTKKAFANNEEIALSLDVKKKKRTEEKKIIRSLKKYVETLDSWKIGSPTSKISMAKSIRDIFLKGRLYRDAKEQDPLRIPLNLPEDYLDSLSSQQNIRDDIYDYLEIKALNSLSLEKIITNANLKPPSFYNSNWKNTRASWKNYCIESCYGFWAPEDYIKKIKDSLDDLSGNKEEKIKELNKFVIDNFASLQDSFTQVIKKIQNNRENNKVGSWTLDNLPEKEIRKKWDSWWRKISTKLTDEKYEEFRERFCRGVIYTCVPDLWDDPISAKEFEHSVCESIRYYLSLKEKTSKKICNKIKELLLAEFKDINEDEVEKILDKKNIKVFT